MKYYDDSEGFALAYERIIPSNDGIGRLYLPSTGIDPYDKNLPEPRTSILRHVLDWHLVEITFKGSIDLEFDGWLQEPHWKYWKVIPPNKKQLNCSSRRVTK